MKKLLLIVLYTVCLLSFAACENAEESGKSGLAESVDSTPVPSPDETVQIPDELIEAVEIYSAKMWNEFAETYNSERELYADHVTVKINKQLDFADMEFVPLADGFSGKITAGDTLLSEEGRQLWIAERKKWPLDYNGTFINICRIGEVNSKAAGSLFGAAGELELENVSFAYIYLDDIKCLFAENANTLKLYNVRVQNCALSDARAIAAVNAGCVSVEYFTAEGCVLTGYERMSGLVGHVDKDAEFSDIFICRSSFILSPDNGGSGLWGAGIGILAGAIDGTASFENIDIYGCSTAALNTDALVVSVGGVSECKNISLDFCSFMNYRPMGAVCNSGIISNCGGTVFMELPVLEENVSITNSNIGGDYTESDFVSRGYFVENCIFTSSKETPPQ